MKKIVISTIALLLGLNLAMSQGKPDRVKNYKDKAEAHKRIALLPFQFEKKEYKSYPPDVTAETIAEGEKEKGLAFQQLLYEEFSKKGPKHGHEWLAPEKLNATLAENGIDIMNIAPEDLDKIANILDVDAVVYSKVETPKVILPDSKGSEMMWDDSNLYGLSGSGTYVNMAIKEKGDADPYWKWRIKFNGSFKNPKLMTNILEKNYLHDYFPYKY